MKTLVSQKSVLMAVLITLGLMVGLTGCVQDEEDVWPATKEVRWDGTAQQCLHDGIPVQFAGDDAYDSCLSLAYAVVDGVYTSQMPSQDSIEKIVICSEYCEVDGNGGWHCTGVVCAEY